MSKSASELFIVDNCDANWKVRNYLTDWCDLSSSIDVATGYFEIGALLSLKESWQKVDSIRLLMGDEVSKRTKKAFEEGLKKSLPRWTPVLKVRKRIMIFLKGYPRLLRPFAQAKFSAGSTAKIGFTRSVTSLTRGRP